MAATESEMRPLGSELPTFELENVADGKRLGDEWLRGHVAVVAFICNHCPFVIHLKAELSRFGADCKERGVRMVAISSNDVQSYPQDGPELMAREVSQHGYSFPYLFDETQQVARAFGAACTPDFFVFDRAGRLAYRGQFDSSRPSNGVAPTGQDLRAAVDALLRGDAPASDQKPSIGCNIKWRGAQ